MDVAVAEDMKALRDHLIKHGGGVCIVGSDIVVDTLIAKVIFAHRDPKTFTADELFANTAIVAKSNINWRGWKRDAKINLVTTLLQASIPIIDNDIFTKSRVQSFATRMFGTRRGGPVADGGSALRMDGKIKLDNRPCDVLIVMKEGF